MSDQSPQTLEEEQHQPASKTNLMVNDFSIQVATVNGSGSQSSNSVLLRSIFQMGIPVSGKNLFPSNIAGLPTWFTIRVNKDGWIARKKEIDFLIAMNADTARDDVMGLEPGRVVVYEETLRLNQLRKDLTFFPVPFAKIATGITTDARLRKLLANMIYVGVVGELMEIDPVELDAALAKQFKGKAKAIALNQQALVAGRKFAQENLDRQLVPIRCRRMNETTGKIIIDGNSAAALGCMFAGITVATWYPITPSSSLVETLADYMRDYRVGPDGKIDFRDCSGGRRTRRPWNGDRGRLGWSAVHDLDSRPRHFADERIHRACLLCRSAGCDLRRYARGPQHGPSDSDTAVGYSRNRSLLAWRYQTHHVDTLQRFRMLQHGRGCVRPDGTIPDADLCNDGSGSRHE